jgi:pyruvate dehydrogenase E1 component alpha subunit
VHLAVGQEAVAVGVSRHLSASDFVFSAHRSHAHVLALDPNPYQLFAELLGRKTGLSRGYGGSMHLWNGEFGFSGSVPIVSGTISLAVGAGLASKLKGETTIGVAYFGDGAMEEGIVHESLNIASKMQIPVLFVCENNFFSSHLHINERQPSKFTSRFAHAHNVRNKAINGNSIDEVFAASGELISYIRETRKPAFIEAFTFRLFGHVDWREDIDVGVGRSEAEVNLWKSRDPIKKIRDGLRRHGGQSEKIEVIDKEIREKVLASWNKAVSDPFPQESDLLSYVLTKEARDFNVD